MKDLSTEYLGLQLKNPIIVGSCGLTNSIEKIKEFAENNAGAIVLKSLFEEQIQADLSSAMDEYHTDYPGSFDYIREYTRESVVSEYLDLISESKKSVDIPIIASINCVSGNEWVSFAKSIEDAGADGLELNISLLPSDPQKGSGENEKLYFNIINKVSATTSLPIALKMSRYSSALTNLVTRLSWTNKISSFVLFNRYYTPDVNIEKETLKSAPVLSSPEEYVVPLRWIAILSSLVEQTFAASTGIHDSKSMIKQLLVGAAAVQTVSSIYKHGPSHIQEMLNGLEEWMEEKSYEKISDFKGKLSYDKANNPAAFERIQFMKYYGGIS